MSKKYRLDLKYIGGDFHGWQSQANGRGIQDQIEGVLRKVLNTPDLRVNSASRTDSGVHAHMQVGTFISEKSIDMFKLQVSLQALLPRTIGVSAITEVDINFNPQKAAKAKAYRYLIRMHALRDPFLHPFVWNVADNLDLPLMESEAKSLIGTYNFNAFCAFDSTSVNRVRTIMDVRLRRQNELLEIWILGNGFLKQMVRIMVGTLVGIGSGKLPPGSMAKIIESQDRVLAGATAPGAGLTLMHIFYKDEEPSLDFLMERFWGIMI